MQTAAKAMGLDYFIEFEIFCFDAFIILDDAQQCLVLFLVNGSDQF